MTLDTRIRVLDPTPVEPLFRFCQSLLGDPAPQQWKRRMFGETQAYMNHCGQGLPAWLIVTYGSDGPLRDGGVEYAVEITFDTAYSYRGPEGGCEQLHARYVERVGKWCEEHGLRYKWQNEFTGEWVDDWRDGTALVTSGRSS